MEDNDVSRWLQLRCLDCWWNRLLCDDDTCAQRVRKIVFTYVSIGAIIMFPTRVIFWLKAREIVWLMVALSFATHIMFFGVIMPAYMSAKRYVSERFTAIVTLVASVVIALSDLNRAAHGEGRAWPVFVVVVDILFIAEVSRRTVHAACGGIVVWMLLVTADQYLRFGLIDSPLIVSEEERRSEVCECDRFPCPQSAYHGAMSLIIFLIDIVLKKQFIHTVAYERKRMAAAVDIAEDIATRLAAFDLAAAADQLSSPQAACLPQRMRHAYRDLLNHLRIFRPYVPASIVSEAAASANTAYLALPRTCPPPGIDNGKAALAFTDIRSSTSIWEMHSAAMVKALTLHNSLMRSALHEHGGYEVKTFGDAFMLAFETLTAALRYSLWVQLQLLCLEWPDDLLLHPACRRHPDGIWGGLTIRIGLAFGDVMTEQNELTQRCDYFGDVVNRASRLEGLCPPGGTLGSAEQIEAILPNLGLSPAHCATFHRTLRGYSSSLRVMAVFPQGIQGRKETPHAVWEQADLLSSPATRPVTHGSLSLMSTSPRSMASSAAFPHAPKALTSISASLMAYVVSLPGCIVHDPADTTDVTNRLLDAIVRYLSPSGGELLSFVNDTAIASFRGSGHLDAMMKCLIAYRNGGPVMAPSALWSELPSRALEAVPTRTYIGLASGMTLAGSSGSGEQSFLTMMGPAVSIAAHLSRVAYEEGVENLYGTSQAPLVRGRIGACLRFGARTMLYHSAQYVWNTSAPADAREKVEVFEVTVVTDGIVHDE